MIILALEASSSSAKALLFDTGIGVIRQTSRSYDQGVFGLADDLLKKAPGINNNLSGGLADFDRRQTTKNQTAGLQDPDQICRLLFAAAKEVAKGAGVDMIALSSTWHSLMFCDQQLKAVSGVYNWQHTGAADLIAALRCDKQGAKKYYQRTGCILSSIYPYSRLLLAKEQGLDLSGYLLSDQGSYIFSRLTGEHVVSESMASGTGFYSITQRDYDQKLLEPLGISVRQLGILDKDNKTWPLSKAGADLLGLRRGIPVLAAQPDGALNQVGSGALAAGMMTFSVGTSAAMRQSIKEPLLSDDQSTWCYRSPGGWLAGMATSGASNCVDWIKQCCFPGNMSYADIESRLNVNADTPVFLPFLFGERSPGWDDRRRGGLMRLEPGQTSFGLYQSVLEGVLFNVKQAYQKLAGLVGVPDKILLSGGILNSEFWRQMSADILNLEIYIDPQQQASLAGLIRLAMHAADELDLQAQSSLFPTAKKLIRPDPKHIGIYEEKYQRYLDCYHT